MATYSVSRSNAGIFSVAKQLRGFINLGPGCFKPGTRLLQFRNFWQAGKASHLAADRVHGAAAHNVAQVVCQFFQGQRPHHTFGWVFTSGNTLPTPKKSGATQKVGVQHMALQVFSMQQKLS